MADSKYKVTIHAFKYKGEKYTKEEAEKDPKLLEELREIGASFVKTPEEIAKADAAAAEAEKASKSKKK